MHLFIASIAVLGVLAAAQGHDRRFSALASFAAGAHRAPAGSSPSSQPDAEPHEETV